MITVGLAFNFGSLGTTGVGVDASFSMLSFYDDDLDDMILD